MSTPSTPATPRLGYQAPGPFSIAVQNIEPPMQVYVRKDEILQLNVWNSSAGTTVSIGFRMLMSDGQVVDTSQTFALTSARALNTFPIAMEEGYLLSVIVTAGGTANSRGQTFAQVQQGRGNKTGIITPTGLLIQDYVTTSMALAWPGGNIRTPLEGLGWVHDFQVTNPGVGLEWNTNPPARARWRLQGVQWQLVTNGTAANRNAQLQIKPSGTAVIPIVSAFNQLASTTFTYELALNGPGGQVTGFNNVSLSAPATMFVTSQGVIASLTNNLQVGGGGDQNQNIFISVEEWLDI